MSQGLPRLRSTHAVTALLFISAVTLMPQSLFGQPQLRRVSRTRDFEEYQEFLADSHKNFPTRDQNFDFSTSLQNLDESRIDVRTVRDLLDRFSRDASRLTDAMHQQYQQYPELRPYLTAAARLRVRLDSLAKKSGRGYEIRNIAQDFQSIDRDWRSLAHELGQLPGIGRTIPQYVQRINDYDKRLGQIFKIRPQMDRRRMITQTASLSADFENLMDDIEIELNRAQNYNQLLTATRRLRQQVAYIEMVVVDGHTYEDVVQEYQRFRSNWDQLNGQLSKYDNRYVDRSIRRIESADNEVRRVLWLESQADRSRIIAATQQLMHQVDDFYARTPLKLILQLQDFSEALEHAKTFYEVCQNLEDCARRNESSERLVSCYRYVNEEAQLFLTAFRNLRSQNGQAVLNEIEGYLKTLETELNYTSGVDWRGTTELAAQLENFAEHIQYDVKDWLETSRPSYSREAMRAVNEFLSSSRRLHTTLQSGTGSQQEMQREVGTLYTNWQQVYMKYLRNAENRYRDHIVDVSARIVETLFDMKTAVDVGTTTVSGRRQQRN